MHAVPISDTRPAPRLRRYLGVGLIALVLPAVLGLAIAQQMSDGPLTAIVPGGPLRAGPLEPIELQLVEPATSCYVGILLHDGRVYLPCDLGFIWNRFTGSERRVLQLIYYFKHWHEDALRDGRAVLRIDGKRYLGNLERVTDPRLLEELKTRLETMARSWVAPDALPPAPAPTEGPDDVWFFRFDQAA